MRVGDRRFALPASAFAWTRAGSPARAVARGDVIQIEPLVSEAGRSEAIVAQDPNVEGAVVVLENATGAVRALVGGYDFQTSQFNRAIQARRQPGSAFKPFVWGAAVESRRFTPATVVYDTPDLYRDPWTGKEWKPRNFEKDAFEGPMLLGAALAHSKNTVSVKLVDALGPDAVAGFARRLGVESDCSRALPKG